jgi:uncharacterized protein (TIGR01244 family)
MSWQSAAERLDDFPATGKRAMEIRQITEDYFVAPQIAVDDIAAIREAGFRSVISNRPDAEDGAVPHGEVEAAVRAAGLEFRYIPVVSGALTQDNVDAQARALDELPKPVLAYCRSGARCTNLYMLVRQQNG